MAGSDNPMQSHHKKKRLKEMKKNKEERIKARDEEVVRIKTVDGVQEEIRILKRRKNMQHAEQQKLQRLEKELKLVKAAAASKPKDPERYQQHQRPLTELDDPRKSVYYDERMNPYGAPPPGKPRLYHQRGGGVTMNMQLAIVPGEDPPPPPPRAQQQSQPTRRRDSPPPLPKERPPKRRPPSPTPPPPPPPSCPAPEKDNDNKQRNDPNKTNKPLSIPSLPPPSQAVKRSRRGKASSDIWASSEEVEYERQTNQVDLEADVMGAAAPKKKKVKKKKPPLEFYYQDMSQQVQGPFKKTQIREWIGAGFFPPTTLVKTSRNETWMPMDDVPSLQETILPPPPIKQDEAVQDRISALKGGNSIQDRIAALKGGDSVHDRIAALKGGDSVHDRIAGLKQQQDAGEGGEDEEPSAQDRIAALRASHGEQQQQTGEGNEDPCGLPPPPPPLPESLEEPPVYALNDGDRDIGPPPPPAAQTGIDDAPYPTQEGDQAPAPYPGQAEVSPYPVDDMVFPYTVDDKQSPAPNPIDDASGVAGYPTDDGPPSYPVGEGPIPYTEGERGDDGAYPTDTSYPADEMYPTGEDIAYPVTATYPVTDSYPADADADVAYEENAKVVSIFPMKPINVEPPKKTIKVDKDVVAFLPSHLHSRKRKQNAVQPKAKKVKARAEPKKVADIDYDKFMTEIEKLDES